MRTKEEERIDNLRRVLHVHSVIYYFLNTSIVTDAQFDKWANELTVLQHNNLQYKHKGYMPGVFADWNGNTGMHLPVTDAVLARAEWLLSEAEKRGLTHLPVEKKQTTQDAWKGDVGYSVNK